MSSKPAVSVKNLSKCYHLYDHPADRLKQFLWRGRRQYFREFWALRELSLDIMPGDVLGVVGRNGAGKSTLLQLLCGTTNPTSGSVTVHGRIAALLELGAGFNPEFSGRENVLMSAAILGLSKPEIDARFEEIVEFSGIREFIDQPVKTYSSGMYVRLAFSVATSVDPDILVIDEALSVGDGAFARKSFDRIMRLKNEGKTILFCSHSLYQVEVLCNRVLWLDKGEMRALGDPGSVNSAYGTFLDAEAGKYMPVREDASTTAVTSASTESRITRVELTVDDEVGKIALSGISTVKVTVDFVNREEKPLSVALAFFTQDERCVSSVSSQIDNILIQTDQDGHGQACVSFEQIGLLKGSYSVTVWLLCEKALFVHDWAQNVCLLEVMQSDLTQGLVSLPHRWLSEAGNTTQHAPASRRLEEEI